MRAVTYLPDACDRAREELSMALDQELPELDHVRLDAHLASCAACRAFRDQLESTTDILRDTPLEPAPFVVAMPRRRFVPVRALQAGTAAAAVALVAGLASLGNLPVRTASPTLQLGPHATDRGDELIPGTVHFRIRPQRNGDRIAL
jgi:anti-sigma factor RsiW